MPNLFSAEWQNIPIFPVSPGCFLQPGRVGGAGMQNQSLGEKAQRCSCCGCTLAQQFLLPFSISTCSSYRNVCSDNPPVILCWVGAHKSGLIPWLSCISWKKQITLLFGCFNAGFMFNLPAEVMSDSCLYAIIWSLLQIFLLSHSSCYGDMHKQRKWLFYIIIFSDVNAHGICALHVVCAACTYALSQEHTTSGSATNRSFNRKWQWQNSVLR